MFTIRVMGTNESKEDYEWVISAQSYTKRKNKDGLTMVEVEENGKTLQIDVGGSSQIYSLFIENGYGKTIDCIR